MNRQAVLLALCIVAPAAGAQFRGDERCFAAIPASAMRRGDVSLRAAAADSESNNLVAALDRLAESVARRIRDSLRTPAQTLVEGEPRFNWREADVTVHLVGRTGGWTVTPSGGSSESALALMIAATARQAMTDDSPIALPRLAGADSVVISLTTDAPSMRSENESGPPNLRPAFPMFNLLLPAFSPVKPLSTSAPRYPSELKGTVFKGSVTMQFVVDTTGRADPATIKDLRIRDSWTGADYEEGAHQRFREETTAWLRKDARFEPARVAGCKVRDEVRQPFRFAVRR